MGIVPLSESTIRVFSSSLVLHDTISVVKELLDNALDAHASNVVVEVSANTLDVIQLRDNGGGVGVEDRQLLCKRACTSKIRTIDDLERLGGSSLGFRGEALASIAELSEDVTVTTRVEGEVVGTLLKYGPAGQMLSSSSASHPVGTTVKVNHFLHALPVRKQTVVKTTARTLSNIKKLLQSYAFARPTTTFSLKVLKAKNVKANWLYGANHQGNLLQAAASIVGKDIASRCELKHIRDDSVADIPSQESSMRFDALLYSTDTELDKIDSGGQFIAIDGRPVNATRGTVHEILKLYKCHFQSSYHQKHGVRAPQQPFLCLHLRCPPKSYDVNVEPAKDEVLFSDSRHVVDLATQLFIEYYGPIVGLQDSELDLKSVFRERRDASTNGFDVLLAKRPPPVKSSNNESRKIPSQDLVGFPSSTTSTGAGLRDCETDKPRLIETGEEKAGTTGAPLERTIHNMYSLDEGDLDHGADPDESQSRVSSEHDDVESIVRATNPWSIARMNAPIRTKTTNLETANEDEVVQPEYEKRFGLSGSSAMSLTKKTHSLSPLFNGPELLPTPAVSPRSPIPHQNPGPPLRPWRRREDPARNEVVLDSEPSEHVPREQSHRPLDTWITHRTDPNGSAFPRAGYEQRSTTSGLGGLSQSTSRIFDAGPPSSQSDTNRIPSGLNLAAMKPFRSPLKASFAKIVDLPSHKQSQTQQTFPAPLSPNEGSPKQVDPDTDLAEIMEWERRKKALAKKHREQTSSCRSENAAVDPVSLARIQQESTQLDGDTNMQSSPITNDSITEQATRFEDKFGPRSPATPPASSPVHGPNNPHSNRYLAAIRNLPSANIEKSTPPADARNDTHYDSAGAPDFSYSANTPEKSPIPETDPRGYLMRHQKELSDISRLSKNGLMLRRVRTMRLPLETTVKGAEVHNLVLKYVNEEPRELTALAAAHTAAVAVDGYVKSGSNELVTWSAFSRDVAVWQSRLRTLIQTHYRARVGEDTNVYPNVEIALGRAIKNHIEHNENSHVWVDAQR